MTSAKRLFELQQLDMELQNLQETIDDINRQLTENESLNKAKNDLAEAKTNLSVFARQQKELDQEVAALAETVKNLKNKLYGGTVKNPKELMGLEQDLNSIKINLSAKEDSLLALMTEVETIGEMVNNKSRQVLIIESTWKTEKTVLIQKKEKIDSRIAELMIQKQNIAGGIDQQTLGLYATMKAKRGTAVARVEQGRCQGCRVNLSVTELKQSRNSILQCSSCGRILFAG